MNIFVTSNCPIESARYLDDKRIVKMSLETAQMLSTVLQCHGICDDRLYKPTHTNHPANVWARETNLNYLWLLAHFEELLEQYTLRYSKKHASGRLLPVFYEYLDVLPEGRLTPFVNCAANDSKGVSFKHIEDTTTAYKLYLLERWKKDVRTPTWFKKPVLETEE